MNRIEVNPEIHFGKPCIAGTRIPIEAILELVREGIAFDVIIRNYYSDIKVEEVKACLQYAIDVVQAEDIHFGMTSLRFPPSFGFVRDLPQGWKTPVAGALRAT